MTITVSDSAFCKNNIKWPVADIKGCLLEDIYYGKTDIDDPELRESRAQLKKGGVDILSTPVFAEDKSPAEDVIKQSEIFQDLPTRYPNDFYIVTSLDDIKNAEPGKVGLIGSIENAGALFSGAKGFDDGVKVFEKILNNTTRLLYVSLTWKYENVLGGGDTTKVGLKDYGKKLLNYLSRHNKGTNFKIAVDISHASDSLSKEIFEYIDKNALDLMVVASHSSLRSIRDIPRNVPDWAVKEIIKRGGVVGLNFINGYIGKEPYDFLKHFEYAIKELGGNKGIVFGADWFMPNRPDVAAIAKLVNAYFFDRYSDASKYQLILNDLKKRTKLTDDQLNDISHKNFVDFVSRQWGK